MVFRPVVCSPATGKVAMDAEVETVEPVRHKLDVHAYHRMGETGILGRDDRVELIDGELIDMVPISWDHADTVNGLNKALVMACGDRAVVSVQNPVRLDEYNEPQPDFAVLRPRTGKRRAAGPPGPVEVLLLVEVANSSLRFDRKVKLPLYARFGIREVWIVDLKARVLECHRDPGPGGYAPAQPYGPGDAIALAADPEIVVGLDAAFE